MTEKKATSIDIAAYVGSDEDGVFGVQIVLAPLPSEELGVDLARVMKDAAVKLLQDKGLITKGAVVEEAKFAIMDGELGPMQ